MFLPPACSTPAKLFAAPRVFALLAALLLLLPGNGVAQAAVFTIDNVDVDISAGSALSARESAIAWAEREAFSILLKKLTLEADHSKLPSLSDTNIKALVEGIQIEDEKTASRRYLATISVKFRAAEIRDILNALEIPMAESEARSLLLLPVYEFAGALTLWEEANAWFQAWREIDLNNRLQPLQLPGGDFQDLLELSALQALRQDSETFEVIKSRYGVDAVMTIAARLTTNYDLGVPRLTVNFAGSSADLAIGSELVFEGAKGMPHSELLAAAAKGIADYLEGAWKDQVVLRSDELETLVVWQRVSSLTEWLTMRARMSQNPLIREFSMRSLRTDSVELEFSHAGSQDQVIAALALQEIFLVEADGFWEIGFGTRDPAPSENPELEPLRFDPPAGYEPESPALSERGGQSTLRADRSRE